ncbi:Aste57867_2012 [Aphanomyces stellatus]|uniref:Aste57867_2012 protein n=1 Tax=Aphanomyces stellatus TaxID=120398 RepID=A0A485KAV6_9STRA|nr:hypothetical protein As57867_002010 [Aphanomyces stellatus]VFT79216.1 Aste57867_2012 [Aphanomyces stellatus]
MPSTSSQLALEFKVQGIQSTKWCQFLVVGQTLDILDSYNGGRLYSMSVEHITIQYLSGHHFQLQKKGKPCLLFSSPSTRLLSKLETALQLACESVNSTLPPTSDWANLIDVASAIVETESNQPLAAIPSQCHYTVDDMLGYLNQMSEIFAALLENCTSTEGLYDGLLDMEAEFVMISASNVLETLDDHSDDVIPVCNLTSLREILNHCPHCHDPLTTLDMYSMHVQAMYIVCRKCGDSRSDTKRFNCKHCVKHKEMQYSNSQWQKQPMLQDQQAMRCKLNTALAKYCNRPLGTLGFDFILTMMHHLNLSNCFHTNMEYWMQSIVLQACLIRYNKFLHLTTLYPNEMLVPTCDILLIESAKTNESYEVSPNETLPFALPAITALVHGDKQSVLEAYIRTCVLWSTAFDEPYSSFAPNWLLENLSVDMKRALAQGKLKLLLPSPDCRFVGVDDIFQAVPTFHSQCSSILPAAKSVFVAVIGTPIMDDRLAFDTSPLKMLLVDSLPLPTLYFRHWALVPCNPWPFFMDVAKSIVQDEQRRLDSEDNGLALLDCNLHRTVPLETLYAWDPIHPFSNQNKENMHAHAQQRG